jgi:hypothetical protein
MGAMENDHGRWTAEALSGIGKDFAMLKRLSFAGAFLSHSGTLEMRQMGFISVRSMCVLVSHPAAKDLNEDTAQKWLSGIEAIQKSLHALQNTQLDGMAKFGLAGILTAFLVSIGVLLSTLGLVIDGYPGWLAVLGFLSGVSTYAALSIFVEPRLKRRAKAVADSLLKTCNQLPMCLWNDIHDDSTISCAAE